MKRPVLLSLLSFTVPLWAAPVDDATALLQSRKYAEAAAAFAALPPDAAEPGQTACLRALSLHLAGNQEEAAAIAGTVPANSPWGLKSRFLQAAAFTKAKRHREAEAIYAAEAARAFSAGRRDVLVKQLLDFAEELVTPQTSGEVTPPQPDWQKAAALCGKVLDMPVTAELRSEVLLRKANFHYQGKDFPNAEAAYNAWLLLSDPEWRLPLEPGKKNTGALLTGRERAFARLRLAESLLAAGRTGDARLVSGHLIALLETLPADSPHRHLAGDAAWLHTKTFAVPSAPQTPPAQQQLRSQQQAGEPLLPPGQQGDAGAPGRPLETIAHHVPFPQREPNPGFIAEDYLIRLRDFLKNYPAHTGAPDAAEAIAVTLDATGKDREAIAAWTDFIEARSFRFDAAAPASRKPDPASGLTPAESLLRKQQTAAFRIGTLHAGGRRYTEAVAQWRKYIADYPNGAEWNLAQSGIVDAEFQTGLTAVAAGDGKTARETFDAFLGRYPLDPRAPQILFIYGQTHYAAAQLMKEQNAPAEAVKAEFEKAMTEWSRLTGKYPDSEPASLALYNTALILSEELDRPEEGLAAFKRVIHGQWAGPAKDRITVLEGKSLAVAAPRVFRSNETPHVAVSLRNLQRLRVSRYPLDLEAWFRRHYSLEGIERLDVDLIAPEKTWEVEVKDFARLRSLKQEVEIPFPDNTAGACIVRVESDDWQATTLVLRSDLELISESTRKEGLAFVVNARENKPAAGVTVLVSDGTAITGSGQTGEDGIFKTPLAETAAQTRLFLVSPAGMAASHLDMSTFNVTKQPETAEYATLDRQSYVPGQTVHYHFLRRNLKDGVLSPATSPVEFTIRVRDFDGRLITARPAKWEADGTLAGTFHIPSNAPAGSYSVQLLEKDDKILQRANFEVRERPVASQPVLTLKLHPANVLPGDKVKGVITAEWPWGLPVVNEPLSVRLPFLPEMKLRTDAGGSASFEFIAEMPADSTRDCSYQSVISLARLDISVTAPYVVSRRPWKAHFLTNHSVIAADDPVTVKVKVQRYDDKPAAERVHFALYRLSSLPPGRVLEGVPWLNFEQSAPVETLVEEFDETSAAETGLIERKLTVAGGGHYLLRLTGGEGQGALREEQRFFVSGSEDVAGLRFYSETTVVNEGGQAVLRLHAQKAHERVLLTVHADHFLSHQVLSVPAGFTEVKFPVTAAHAPNFRVTAAVMDGLLLRTASIPLSVRQGLLVTFAPGAETVSAGAGLPVHFKVTDLAGNPVPDARAMLGMERLHDDPDITLLPGPAPRMLTLIRPFHPRELRLSMHTTAALAFPGVSARVTVSGGSARGVVELVVNDQDLTCRIQEMELSNNRFNSTMALRNELFTDTNSFLAGKRPAKAGGPLVFSPGVKTPRDPLAGLPGLSLETPGADSSDEPADPYAEFSVPAHANEGAQLLFNSSPGRAAYATLQSRQQERRPVITQSAPANSAVWIPAFTAAQPLTAPQQEGVWRLVVRVTSPASGLVEMSGYVLVTSPVTARLFGPVPSGKTGGGTLATYSLRDGDQAKLTGELIYRSEGPGTAEVTFNGGWKGDSTSKPRSVTLEPPAMRYPLLLDTGNPDAGPHGRLAIPFTVSAGGHTREMTVAIPRPERIPSVRSYYTIRPAANGRVTLAIPAAAEGTQARSLTWTAWPDRAALLTALAQPVSLADRSPGTLHATVVAAAQQTAGREALHARAVDLLSAFALSEKEGGWSWNGLEQAPDILTTAQVWCALLEAKAAGFTVSGELLERVETFITRSWTGLAADDYEKKACVLHSLAVAGKADYANAAPLLRAKDSLTPAAAAWLAAALIRMDRPDDAGQLLDLLEAKAERAEGSQKEPLASWPGSARTVRLSEREQATAVALWSFCKLRREHALTTAAANWLLQSRAVAPESETFSRGPVAVALAEYFKDAPAAPADSRVTLTNGEAVDTITANGGVTVFTRPLGNGETTLVIKTENGPQPLVFLTVSAFPSTPADPQPWGHPQIAERKYLHDTLVVDDLAVDAASTSPVTRAEAGQRLRVAAKMSSMDGVAAAHPQYILWDEPLPGGCVYVPGSARGNFNRLEERPGLLRFTFAPGVVQDLSYEIIALSPGQYTVPPSILRDAYDSSKYRPGPSAALTILAPGEKSPDPYQMNAAEHYVLARRDFAADRFDECLQHLEALNSTPVSGEMEREIARMRLWILSGREDGDARAIISAFELLTERYPELVIPFEKLLKVGPAYRKLNEFERAATVYRAALDGAFIADSSLGVALEDHGDYDGAVRLQEALWREYPDSRDVRDALTGLAQSLSAKAPVADTLPVRRGQKKLERNALLTRSRDLLLRYLTVYPADDMADDAAFSLVNVYFALKDYTGVVQAATAGAERYAGEGFADGFRYMAALGHFWLGTFDKALEAAAPVANGESKDRDYARYVTAQVHHAMGQIGDAITWYNKVREVYPDAAEAIAWFEEKKVSLPEVTIFKPGEEVKLTLDYRNVKEAALQLYKVDLMKLYLREKSLSNITQVNLAGIRPQAGETMTLGEGKDYTERKHVLTLPVKEEGAYLAIVRGDNLFTSGLVLISSLKLEVKEHETGTVRVNVTDAASGRAVADAEVKALGSGSPDVQAGSTDPRGVYQAGNIRGIPAIVVKVGDNRYAFHRGTRPLGFDPTQIPQTFGGENAPPAASGKQLEKRDYLMNIEQSNKAVQESQIQNWESKRRGNTKGVEAKDVLKK